MVRKYKKMALYEAMSKLGPDSSRNKTLEKLHPGKQPIADGDDVPASYNVEEKNTQKLNRPRLLQLNMGRVEVSLPYPIVIAGLLVIILLFLVAFRLGQLTYEKSVKERMTSLSTAGSGEEARFVEEIPTADEVLSGEKITDSANNIVRDNWIVIQTLKTSAPLEPVKNYFAEHGIETEIRKIGDSFYLLTKEKYENPMKPGTDGYTERMKIIELGANYVSPPGYDSFGTKPFHDAYGMKSRD